MQMTSSEILHVVSTSAKDHEPLWFTMMTPNINHGKNSQYLPFLWHSTHNTCCHSTMQGLITNFEQTVHQQQFSKYSCQIWKGL